MLVLTYSIEGKYLVSEIPFKDMKTCGLAIDAIYPTIYANYRNSMAQCKRTKNASSSIKPKMRPNNG
tara:strand:- start:532 stop:732 length:201 start_codon:yes stop_codon:yes gene_type:complete